MAAVVAEHLINRKFKLVQQIKIEDKMSKLVKNYLLKINQNSLFHEYSFILIENVLSTYFGEKLLNYCPSRSETIYRYI